MAGITTTAPLAAPDPRGGQSGKGILLMALGMFIASAVDTQAKFLTETLHPIQIVWTRQLGLLLGAFVLLALRGPALLSTDRLGIQIARGACAAASATTFIMAVGYVALADAVFMYKSCY